MPGITAELAESSSFCGGVKGLGLLKDPKYFQEFYCSWLLILIWSSDWLHGVMCTCSNVLHVKLDLWCMCPARIAKRKSSLVGIGTLSRCCSV